MVFGDVDEKKKWLCNFPLNTHKFTKVSYHIIFVVTDRDNSIYGIDENQIYNTVSPSMCSYTHTLFSPNVWCSTKNPMKTIKFDLTKGLQNWNF